MFRYWVGFKPFQMASLTEEFVAAQKELLEARRSCIETNGSNDLFLDSKIFQVFFVQMCFLNVFNMFRKKKHLLLVLC